MHQLCAEFRRFGDSLASLSRGHFVSLAFGPDDLTRAISSVGIHQLQPRRGQR